VAPVVLVVLVVASFCDQKKFYTLLNHVLLCGEFHTTFLHHPVVEKVFSLSDPRTVFHEILDPCGLSDLPVQQY
jgi:hypothetical protein